MTTVLFANQIYSERYSYSYAVLKEKEQSFDVMRSYKVKNGNCIVVDIGSQKPTFNMFFAPLIFV